MARTSDQVQSDIDTMRASLGKPERVVRFSDGRQVEYFTPDEKLKAISALQEELATLSGRRSNSSVAQHSRGNGPSGPPRWYW